MIAFLKRRWILLSCAVVLLGCSAVEIQRSARLRGDTWVIRIKKGNFLIYDSNSILHYIYHVTNDVATSEAKLRAPMFGGIPGVRFGNAGYLSVPLWLPLSAILGWLVIRELRWREKRARKAE